MNRNQTCHSTTLKNAEYSPRSSHVYPSRGIRVMQRDSAQNVSIKDHPLCAEVLRTYMYVPSFPWSRVHPLKVYVLLSRQCVRPCR